MKLFNIRKVMVLVSVSIHEARVSSTFFGGLKASRRWKLKKIIILENIKSNELSLVFSKIVSKGLCCDKVWGFRFFILHTYPWYLQILALNADSWNCRKKTKLIEIWPKRRHSSVFPENAKCSVMSHTRWRQGGHYRNICKYTVDGPADFAGR